MGLVTIAHAGVAGTQVVTDDAYTSDWQPLGWSILPPATPEGMAAYLRWREDWSGGVEYQPSDAVKRSGAIYVARLGSIGHDPATDDGTFWAVFMPEGAGGGTDDPNAVKLTGDQIVTGKKSVASVHVKSGPEVSLMHADFGVVGNGSADDQAAYQAAMDWAASNNYTLHHPGGVSTYMGQTTPLNVPSGLRWRGDGYRSVLLSDAPASSSSPWAFAQSNGWAAASAWSNAWISGLRFRRTNSLAGTSPSNMSPYDAAIRTRNGRGGLLVEKIICEGGVSGIVAEAWQDGEIADIWGYQNADGTVRNAWAGAGGTLGATRARDHVIRRVHSFDCGYALDGVSTVSDLYGSAILLTQPGTRVDDCFVSNSRYHGIETGAAVTTASISRFRGYCDIAGRDSSILLANCADIDLDADFEAHAGGGVGVIIAGVVGVNGNTIGQSAIRIHRLVGLNDWKPGDGGFTAGTSQLTLLNLQDVPSGGGTQNDSSDITVRHLDATRLYVRAAGPSSGSHLANVRLYDSIVRNAPQQGLFLSRGVFDVRRVRAIDCGEDTGQTNAVFRSGMVFDNAGAGSAFADLWSGDSRSGGARRQQYGYYREGGTGTWDRIVASNNVTADKFDGGSPSYATSTFVPA